MAAETMYGASMSPPRPCTSTTSDFERSSRILPVSRTGPSFGSSATTDHAADAGAASGRSVWRSQVPIVQPWPDNRDPSARRSIASSELGAAGRARKGDHIADVFHSSQIHQHTFESEAESGVGRRPILAKLEVPPVGRFRQRL